MAHSTIPQFQKTIWNYYKKHKRSLPWRKNINPYRILVSEVMLQQTQVSRVIPRYYSFLKMFPTVSSLAKASLAEVLGQWQGLGYYRRAKFLHMAAREIVSHFGGKVPKNVNDLKNLPGIGPNTAGSIAAYAFNSPRVFIETNIRKIYLHHFFGDRDNVPDGEIMPLVEAALDMKNPREWYWALMDYGAYIASAIENPNKRSKHYVTQSKFEGSFRQLRARVLKLFLEKKSLSKKELKKDLDDGRVEIVLEQLLKEQFIKKQNKKYVINPGAIK